MAANPFQTGNPRRPVFYEAQLEGGEVVIAEWANHDGKGRRWWRHVSDEPTQVKTPRALDGVVGYRSASTASVEKSLRRELTTEERIQEALRTYLSRNSEARALCGPLPPVNRQLAVGDAAQVGALRECTVAAVAEGGQVIVVRSMTDSGDSFMAMHWSQVCPGKPDYTRKLTSDSLISNDYLAGQLYGLIERVRDGLDDSPDYQRGYAWNDSDKALFLDSLFNGREIGRFLFVVKPSFRYEVVDGKQRLNCVWELVTSAIAYRGVYWHEMTLADRMRIERRVVQFADLSSERYTRADLLRIFLEVNVAGVPQTEEHLKHVRQLLADELAKTPA
jgi:hypothetical protein